MVYRNSIGGDFKQHDDIAKRRAAWFLALVRESQIAQDAWIISSPGDETVCIESLQTSSWPDELKRRGYPLVEIEPGERILHMAYHQPLEISSSGVLVSAAIGSTKPVTTRIHGAGPQPTRRYTFRAPRFSAGR
jgi:hypothetical protein